MVERVEHGTVLGGRYRLLEALATDPVIHVWRAEDIELQRPVVCKVLHPRLMDDDEMVERFRFGAFAATRLDHENIARTYDVEFADGFLYTVTEHVDGPDVGALIAAGPLPVEAVAAIGQQAAAGLSAAHDLGLAHAGVCPRNLMVGSGGRLCLIDFGSVQFEHTADIQSDEAGEREPGIRDYWAPERLAGGGVETAGDMYSLGLVLWEALTGEPVVGPAAPDDPSGPVRWLFDGLTGGNDDLEPRLREILATVVADDPAERPSATALAEQLVEICGVRPQDHLAALLDDRATAG